MRALLILWAIPLILFWGWYGLSAYDISFGLYFLEREFHDLIFQLYSNVLGIPAEDIPGWLAWVFFIDSLILFFGVAAVRWYKLWLSPVLSWTKQKLGFSEPDRDYVRNIYAPLAPKQVESFTGDLIGPVRPGE